MSPPAASPTWSTRGLPAPSRQPAGPGRAMAPTCNTNLRHPAALRSRSHIPDGQSEMLRLLCPIARAHDPVRPCTRHPECCWLAGEYLLPQFQPRARNAVRGSSLRPAASTQATWQPRCCPPSCSSSTTPTTRLLPVCNRENARLDFHIYVCQVRTTKCEESVQLSLSYQPFKMKKPNYAHAKPTSKIPSMGGLFLQQSYLIFVN